MVRPRQRPRDRVDRDSVTDPSPGWDHHTLARGPLCRSMIFLSFLSLKIVIDVGTSSPHDIVFCCILYWCHPWRWHPSPSAAFIFVVSDRAWPLSDEGQPNPQHCASLAGHEDSGSGRRRTPSPPSSSIKLAPPPLEVLPPHSLPRSTRCVLVVGDCAPGATNPRSHCAGLVVTRRWGGTM